MSWGVVVFPGTNREHDAARALEAVGAKAELLWHADGDRSLAGYDGLILPGGFAHGDALRAGAIARFSPILPRIVDFAATGRPVVGICNGFQVLLECGLLPGALQRNSSLQFRAGWVRCRVETPLFGLAAGTVMRIPIAHGQGNYLPDPHHPLGGDTLVALRYCDAAGNATPEANPNGSWDNIAGIIRGNVLGMMPHPEDAVSELLGSTDGKPLFQALVGSMIPA